MARTTKKKTTTKNPTAFKNDERNVNVHNDRSRSAVKESLAGLGAGRSILVDNTGTIIAGECTHEQAKELGIPLQIVETDGNTLIVVKRTDLELDDPKRRALAIADNKTSMLSEFDYAAMASELKELDLEFDSVEGMDLQITGFADFELTPLLAAQFTPPEIDPDSPPDEGHAGSGTADNAAAGLQSDGINVFFGQDQYETVERLIAYAHDQQGDEASDSECIIWALLKVLDGTSF